MNMLQQDNRRLGQAEDEYGDEQYEEEYNEEEGHQYGK